MTPARSLPLALLTFAALLGGCLDDVEPMPDDQAADAEPEPEPEPDPNYTRTCQAGDFDCSADGCVLHVSRDLAGCYLPCAPGDIDAVGQRHPDCTEPERPFCSEVGLWLGGDYSCNGCAYICTAEPGEPGCQTLRASCQ